MESGDAQRSTFSERRKCEQKMKFFTSSSSSSTSSSGSFSDRQFCLTGLQTSSELPDESKGIAKQMEIGYVRMAAPERQRPETGSDTDSGNGTVFSDNPESPPPMRDAPPSFPDGHGCDSSGSTSHGHPKGHRATLRGNEGALSKPEIENEEVDDDGCPVSPTYEANRSLHYGQDSPSEVSCQPRGSHQDVSGFVYPVVKLHHVLSTELDLPPVTGRDGGDILGDRIDPRISTATPKISGTPDTNSNSSPEPSSPNPNPNPNPNPKRYFSSHADGDKPLCDSEEIMTSYFDDLNRPTTRPRLQAKCLELYGSRSTGFGSREICSRLGCRQDSKGSYSAQVDRNDRLHDNTPVSNYRDGAFKSNPYINTGHDVSLGYVTVASCPYGSRDMLRTTSHDAVRDMSLRDDRRSTSNDSLTDCFRSPSPSEAHTRRYVRHGPGPHPTKKHFDGPLGADRYTSGYQESSFNSPMGIDSQMYGDGRATGPEGNPHPRGMNTSEYRRFRSIPYEYGFHAAMQLPFSEDDAPATFPRPNKPGARGDGSFVPGQTTHSPIKGRHRRPPRRWTNSGVSETDPEVTHVISSDTKASSSSTKSGSWFNVSSILKPKKHASTNSLASEPQRTERRFEPEAVEVTSVRLPVTRDFSSPSVFEMVNLDGSNASSDPNSPTRNDQFLQSSSLPSPDGRARHGVSFLKKFLSQLTTPSKSKNSSTATWEHRTTPAQHREGQAPNLVSQSQGQTPIGCDRVSNGPNPVATATISRFHSLQESQDDKKISMDKLNNFATLQTQKSATGNRTGRVTLPSSPAKRKPAASAPYAKGASPAEFEPGEDSGLKCHEQPSEVTVVLSEVAGLIENVYTYYATSNTEADDRSILEEEFNEYKHAMIDSLKGFIDQCKLMVIKTPASLTGFLEELAVCRRMLGVVFERCRSLVECTSLPADRAGFADGIRAVATSFRATVSAASDAAGRTAKHPTVKMLRRSALELVMDLTNFMRMIREMHYNRLSRRF